MVRLTIAAFSLLFILAETRSGNSLRKYKAVEAYELRPGILGFPRYAEDSQICEIGVERRQYSGENITLGSTMSRGEIDAVVDELAPPKERGQRSKSSIDGLNTITGIGQSMREIEDYDKLTVQIEGSARLSTSEATVVILKWKGRTCK